MTRLAASAACIALALALTACGAPDTVHEPDVAALAVTSNDFTGGGEIPQRSTADALGGQCVGDNISPQLAWGAVPNNTTDLAITLIDTDAGDFAHWMIANVPGSVTSIARGGADALTGVGGKSSLSSAYDGTYFGPCPPGPDHHYVFTVYALDAPLDLKSGFTLGELRAALKGHVLAQGSLTGLRSGPA